MKKLILTIPSRPKRKCPIIVEANALQQIPDLIGSLLQVDGVVILYDKTLEKIANDIAALIPPCAAHCCSQWRSLKVTPAGRTHC